MIAIVAIKMQLKDFDSHILMDTKPFFDLLFEFVGNFEFVWIEIFRDGATFKKAN
ncbi:hypothetical protein FD38_GL002397 [Levilactobacillus zymae DSM 19395]|nr:hypothetical protein FD38_GL002397 [Levilactobacillus zymae DSM 19395]